MAQLSRTKKYQELRDSIDKETTIVTESAMTGSIPSRLSRAQSNNLSHANQPLHPHEEIKAKPIMPDTPSSPVMDDLLDEVKQYNIDNGNRYIDDTQVNILKQLDGNQQTRKRNAHFVPMEEDEENLGTTMQMSTPMKQDVDGVATYMPNQKLTRINPVNTPVPNATKIVDEEEDEEIPEKTTEKIVLTGTDIRADDPIEESDKLSFFSSNVADDFDRTVETPIRTKKPKKVKKARKQREVITEDDASTAKMRMKTGDVENIQGQKKAKKSETIFTVVLVILIILLLISIGFTFYFLYTMR